MDEALDIYSSFKFVVAFENSKIAGYITEKLVLPYLAGAIPIYLGPSDVRNIFNSRSMINCDDFLTLVECVDEVIRVNNDDDAYIKMLTETVITGYNFRNIFSWIF